MERETFLDLIPAYALGALDNDERAEVEAWLADDAEAQALLAEYQAIADALVLGTPARTAPAHLGDDLRQRIAARPPAQQRSSGASIPPLMLRWLSAAAILVIIFGVTWALSQLQAPPADEVCPDTQTLYRQIISAPDYLRVSLSPGEEFTSVGGDLVADPSSNAAIMHMKNLPPLDETQTYQLWLAGPDQVVSGGLFQQTGSDTCIILPLEYPLEQYNGFGVSLEPAGGSPNPNQRSGPRVVNVRLREA